MAAAQSTGLLFRKLGKVLAPVHEKVKTQEIKPVAGGGDLPAGMNGIAELKELRFTEIKKEGANKGKMMLYASGVVVEPETFVDKSGNKYFTRGMRTSVTRPLYDTPTRSEGNRTLQEHWNWVVQLLGRLGVSMADVTFENVEDICAQIAKAGIHFRFRTWKGEPQKQGKYAGKEPLLNQIWEQAIDFTPPDVPAQMVQDDTPPEEPHDDTADVTTAEGEEVATEPEEMTNDTESPPVEEAPKSTRFGSANKPKATTKSAQNKPTTTPAPAKNGQTKPTTGGKPAPKAAPKKEPTLEEMAAEADTNEDFQDKLTRAANEAGITDDEIANTDGGWPAVVEEIRQREHNADESKHTTNDEVEEVSDEPQPPAVNDVFLFTDPKTKKQVQGQIIKVGTEDQEGKVNIKNLTDNRIYNVSISALTPMPE